MTKQQLIQRANDHGLTDFVVVFGNRIYSEKELAMIEGVLEESIKFKALQNKALKTLGESSLGPAKKMTLRAAIKKSSSMIHLESLAEEVGIGQLESEVEVVT